jgi:hypothetical protein
MANLETQILDDIIVKSRRRLLTLGGTALAGLIVGGATEKAHAATTYTDSDILNFALNLEYLEANFYYISAFGCTIDKPNAAAIAAGAPSAGIPITVGVGTPGTVTCSVTGPVPFGTTATGVTIGSYATETAIEEGRHVLFLQTALGSSTQVAQPAINLDIAAGGAWPTLAAAANKTTPAGMIPPNFSPYAAGPDFLVGAYVFEDVGVTAYHGAASLLTVSGNLSAAGGILAVEAYHAGLIRTTINALDPTGSMGFIGYTDSISNLRAALANAASPATLGTGTSVVGGINYDVNPDDYGLAAVPGGLSVTLGTTTGYSSTRITDADTTDTTNPLPLAIAYARTPTQVLNIVTGGGAVSTTTVISPAKGVFFPNGMNAGANGFK